jgi:hypothetical protein
MFPQFIGTFPAIQGTPALLSARPGKGGGAGEVPLPRDTGHICAARGIAAVAWARLQSVNRSGAKKLAINQAAAKRLKGQLVRGRLTRDSNGQHVRQYHGWHGCPDTGPVEADLDAVPKVSEPLRPR